MLLLQEADMGSKGTGNDEELEIFPQIRQLLQALYAENACLQLRDLAVDGKDLLALGFPKGPQLGQCLNHLLEQVVEEKLPNERAALLQAAGKLLML
jgi:tRNA nucleotidyltransferase (CCA-adding enzyme)